MKAAIWSPAERKAWELPQELSVSEWADENRFLDPMTSAEPGQWVTDRTPYLREPMDALKDPEVEEIILMMSTQVGKTECMLNMLGYHMDQDPAPVLWVNAREADARGMCEDRVEPMIKLSPALTGHMTGKEDDVRKLKILMNRMILYLNGANSPAALASKPIRILFMDEIDKYPSWAGKEADPVKLAEERTRTFWNRKKIKCSTPTTREGYISREYEASDKRRFYVPCPHCGHYQVLIFAQVILPKDQRDPKKIKDERLAHYECIECEGNISDFDKQKMLLKGVWAPEGCSVPKNGSITGDPPISSSRGYWINAIYSPWLTFSEIAAEFLDSKDKPEALMNFVNSWLAEVWEEKIEETHVGKIKQLALDYEEKTVPAGVEVLVAGVDVQKDHFYLIIRGWGYGEESWLIRAVRVESWNEIDAYIFKTLYVRPDEEKLQVVLANIDSGYRTDEVYAFCRERRDRARPIKGMDRARGVPYSVTRIEKHAATGKPIPGGIGLWSLDTNFYKDKIARMVTAEPGDPSQWHLFKNPSQTYLKQFCSEHKVIERNRKRGTAREVWKKKGRQTPNHYWDCEVYAMAAADMIHVSALRREGEMQTSAQRSRAGESGRQQSWMGSRGRNWSQRG